MPQFPSLDWFEQVRGVFNSDDSYQQAGGGLCDAVMGVKVGDKAYLVVFEGMECAEAREVDAATLADADFYLNMEYAEWRDMLANIRDNNGADLDYTLNTLDMERDDGLAQTLNGDQYRQDFFYRYNQTFQYFFDASARVQTEFVPEG